MKNYPRATTYPGRRSRRRRDYEKSASHRFFIKNLSFSAPANSSEAGERKNTLKNRIKSSIFQLCLTE
jgi:hypothetical protein